MHQLVNKNVENLNFDFNNFLSNHFKLSFIFDAAYFQILTQSLNKLKGITNYVFPTMQYTISEISLVIYQSL